MLALALGFIVRVKRLVTALLVRRVTEDGRLRVTEDGRIRVRE